MLIFQWAKTDGEFDIDFNKMEQLKAKYVAVALKTVDTVFISVILNDDESKLT